ncbi:MAG: methyltransferase [Deferribacteres bacterium]|nr:methyltransferase [candidate division KSB1 bacterium]MCB9503912.1 methyltransferase [Deferribacteres bacterium]
MKRRKTTFVYKDENFGDNTGLVIETGPNVFKPTSTTTLLLSAVRMHAKQHINSALDLGCGCGIVAVALAKVIFPRTKIYASDISEAAVALTQRNALAQECQIDCRCGSLFSPWTEMKFDLIIDDVAAIAEPIARRSRWYPSQILSAAGRDGTRWIVQVLSEAQKYLNAGGQLFFPVLTLSNQTKILDTAHKNFQHVEKIAEEWYPLGPYLVPHLDLLLELKKDGQIELLNQDESWFWATKIFRAY